LVTLDRHSGPFPAFATALRDLAAGRIPSVPMNWPTELQTILENINQAIRDSPPA
jgi:hypothetical protein